MKLFRNLFLVAILGGPVLCAGCGGIAVENAAQGDDGGPKQDSMPGEGGPAEGGPPACLAEGLQCTSGAQCCTPEICFNGVCSILVSDSGPTDGPIVSDSPVIIFDSGPCLVDLEPCITGGQCCSGFCLNDTCESPDGGPPLCQPDGSQCATFAQCCSGVCGGGICGGFVFDSGPVCQPDGTQCLNFNQCCSGVCGNGICGGVIFDSGPVCEPDGFPCQTFSQCCSGTCSGGTCGPFVFDSGPFCAPPAPNPCAGCLAGACCPQLTTCESDPACNASLSCFDSCFTPGNGPACAQKCNAQFPSPNEGPLQ
jgi:hypothetical protein